MRSMFSGRRLYRASNVHEIALRIYVFFKQNFTQRATRYFHKYVPFIVTYLRTTVCNIARNCFSYRMDEKRITATVAANDQNLSSILSLAIWKSI
jgi:hypothetical protein